MKLVKLIFCSLLLSRSSIHAFSTASISPTRPSTFLQAQKSWKKTKIDADQRLPELIVLDLDNTVWTPELYQLNQRKTPKAQKDISLFPDIPLIFQAMIHHPTPPQWAIASRAQNVDWAEQLLDEFVIDDKESSTRLSDVIPPHYIQIYGGSKRQHLQELKEASGIPYHKMIFFDDWTVNLQEVAQLGVLSCHCPNGLDLDIFRAGLDHYHSLKVQDQDNWMGHVI